MNDPTSFALAVAVATLSRVLADLFEVRPKLRNALS